MLVKAYRTHQSLQKKTTQGRRSFEMNGPHRRVHSGSFLLANSNFNNNRLSPLFGYPLEWSLLLIFVSPLDSEPRYPEDYSTQQKFGPFTVPDPCDGVVKT